MCKKTTNHQGKERNVASSIHPPCGREASFVGNPLSCQGRPLGTQLPGDFLGLASTKAAQESSCNPTRARAPETLLKEFQLLEAFTGTSRCVCFKGFFPGLIPTCDNRKHSQKFLSHRRSTCKKRAKNGQRALARQPYNTAGSEIAAFLSVLWFPFSARRTAAAS